MTGVVMGGIFGGILSLIAFLGGCVLFVLVGSRAWSPTTIGRWLRLLAGGATCGGAVAIFLWVFDALFRVGASAFTAVPTAIAFTVALEVIRLLLSMGSGKS